ncbi:MAG: signal peptidase I [Halobacteriales archaeon]|nr:signal peptidase I [Halobacteriales archaeon]
MGTWALAGVAMLVVGPGLLGHPVVSYVASESMLPTLHVGDVFLVNPLARDAAPGEVVLYQSVLRGMPAVHRVVGLQDGGLLTKGDANPGTDQAAGEPPVTPDRVLGVPLASGGSLLVIPALALPMLQAGTFFRQLELWSGSTAQLLAYVALAASLVLLALPRTRATRARGPRSPSAARFERALQRILPRGVLGKHVALGTMLLLATTTLYAASAAREDVGLEMVVTESPPPGQERSAAPGHDVHRDLHVEGLAFMPTVVILDPTARTVFEAAPALLLPGQESVTPVAERAGPDIGLQQDAVHVWRYPAFLPPEAMLALHRVLPGAPALLLGAFLVVAAGAWSFGAGLAAVPARLLFGPRGREVRP